MKLLRNEGFEQVYGKSGQERSKNGAEEGEERWRNEVISGSE